MRDQHHHILTNNPDHSSLGLRLIQSIEVLAEDTNDALVLVGITSENITDDNNSLLDNVVDLLLNQVEKSLDALLTGLLETNGALTNAADSLADNINIDLLSVALELRKDLIDVSVGSELDHNIHLLNLDVDGIVVLAEEDTNLVGENLSTLLDNQVDVTERDVLDLRVLVGEEGDERRSHLTDEGTDDVLAGDELEVDHDDLDGAEDDGGVVVLKSGLNSLDDLLGLTVISGLVADEAVEDVALTPLGALLKGDEKLLEDGGVDLEDLGGGVIGDFAEGGDGVGDDGGILIGNHIVEDIDEALLLDHLGGDIIELADAHGGGLTDVGIGIAQADTKGLGQVLGDLVAVDATHGSDGKSSDQGVLVGSILDEVLDGKNGEIGLLIGVVDEVEIAELLHLHISLSHAVDDINEKLGNIDTDGHEGDDLEPRGAQTLHTFLAASFFSSSLLEARATFNSLSSSRQAIAEAETAHTLLAVAEDLVVILRHGTYYQETVIYYNARKKKSISCIVVRGTSQIFPEFVQDSLRDLEGQRTQRSLRK